MAIRTKEIVFFCHSTYINVKTKFIALLWFVFSLCVCNLNDFFVKILAQDLHFWQITTHRFFFCLVSLIPFIILRGKKQLQTRIISFHFYRGALLVAATALWCLGMQEVHLTTATIITFANPLFVLIFASFLLKEKLTTLRISMTCLGFLGVLLIVLTNKFILMQGHPEYMVIAAALYALSNIANKKYAFDESILSMLFYPALFGLILSGFFAIPYCKEITFEQIGLCFLLGICANTILFSIIKAYQKIDATFLAPLQYFELIPSILLGTLFFHEIPSLYTVLGAVIIIASSLFIFKEKITKSKNGKRV